MKSDITEVIAIHPKGNITSELAIHPAAATQSHKYRPHDGARGKQPTD